MRKICGIIGVSVLALLCTACGSKKEDFKLGETAYARGNYQASAKIFDNNGSFNPRKYDAKFYEGMSKLNISDTNGALSELKDVANNADSRSLRARALDGMGRVYLKTNNPGEAEQMYRKILKEYPHDYPEEDALGGILKSKTAQGDAAGIANARQELAAKYPNSPYLGRSVPATAKASAPKPQGTIYRVRLNKAYPDKASAKAVVAQLHTRGIDSAPVALASGGFGVQMGAYSSAENARARVATLRTAGIPAVVAAN